MFHLNAATYRQFPKTSFVNSAQTLNEIMKLHSMIPTFPMIQFKMFCTAGPTMQVIAPTIYLTAYRNEFISCSTNEMASVEITYDFQLEYFSVVGYVWYCKSQNSEIISKKKDNQSHFHSLSFAHINENTRIYGPFAFAYCQNSISQWFDTNLR